MQKDTNIYCKKAMQLIYTCAVVRIIKYEAKPRKPKTKKNKVHEGINKICPAVGYILRSREFIIYS